MRNAVRRVVLPILLALAIAPGHARAQDWACARQDVASDADNFAAMIEFYAFHARPILGLEQRLANGTAWRVVVDSPTGMAEPRITWMADKALMQRINRLLTALHACSIVNYYSRAASLYRQARQDNMLFASRGYMRQPPDKIVLSYVSPRLVSGFGVDVWSPFVSSRPEYDPSGWVIDLVRNEIVLPRGCDRSPSEATGSTGISLGDLLAICSDTDQLAFHALWERHVADARALAKTRRWPLCLPDAEDDRPDNRSFEVYLAPGGLAVYVGYTWPRSLRQCKLEKSADNPVIIPWRELEPFLTTCPWRDARFRPAPR